MTVRYQWLLRIEKTNEQLKLIPGLSEVQLKSFSLLPLVHHGSIFLGLSDEFLENLWRRYKTGHLRVTKTGVGKQLPQGHFLLRSPHPPKKGDGCLIGRADTIFF